MDEYKDEGRRDRTPSELARREGFDIGVQLGAKAEHDAAVAALADALLRVLGKDRGDGYIDLGAAGRWYPGADNGRAELEQ